jgi:hypothetical protein
MPGLTLPLGLRAACIGTLFSSSSKDSDTDRKLAGEERDIF